MPGRRQGEGNQGQKDNLSERCCADGLVTTINDVFFYVLREIILVHSADRCLGKFPLMPMGG